MIALKDLTVGYHGEALLSQVNLEFPQGQVTVLLGPNGCGKSTLLKSVLGLLPPLGGEILYDGEPISSLSGGAVARKAAYMAQNHTVPSIVAQRMVLHGRFPYLSFPRKYRKEDHEAVRRALETAGGLDLSNRPFLVFDAPMPQPVIGGYDSCLTVEFMRAFAVSGGLTLHQKCEYGDNAHHITEALFKSLGLALKEAVRVEGEGVTSTKGAL